MHPMGTLDWMEKTGGKLGFRDKSRFFVKAFSARIGNKSGASNLVPAGVSPDDLVIPHSKLTKKALSYAEELCEPWLFSHSVRTYFWGLLFARARQLKYDPELLFVAAILHDLGLTSEFENGMEGEHCFAVTGARATRSFLNAEEVEQARSDIICEAIALHLNVSVELDHGVEAHLLHAGTGFDTIRLGRREISKDAVQNIFDLHPDDFTPGERLKDRLVPCLLHQKKIRPHSRCAMLMGLGFDGLVKRAWR